MKMAGVPEGITSEKEVIFKLRIKKGRSTIPSMKILIVGSRGDKFAGVRMHMTDNIIAAGLIRNNHAVYFFDYKAFARGASLFHGIGYKRSNAEVIRIVKDFKPDMVFFGHTTLITDETMAFCRKNCKYLAQWNVDALFKDDNVSEIKRRAAFTDASFITTAGPVLNQFNIKNNKTFFIPNICDNSLFIGKAFENKKCLYDIFFAGRPAVGNAEGDRGNIPMRIKNEISGIKTGYFGFDGTPLIAGAEFFDGLAQSKMSLNLTRKAVKRKATDEELYLYSSDRIAQYMGQGTLTFIETGFSLEKMFKPDIHAVYFDTADELIDKVKFFLKNETARIKIAKAGWEKMHKDYNERRITAFMVEKTISPSPASEKIFF